MNAFFRTTCILTVLLLLGSCSSVAINSDNIYEKEKEMLWGDGRGQEAGKAVVTSGGALVSLRNRVLYVNLSENVPETAAIKDACGVVLISPEGIKSSFPAVVYHSESIQGRLRYTFKSQEKLDHKLYSFKCPDFKRED